MARSRAQERYWQSVGKLVGEEAARPQFVSRPNCRCAVVESGGGPLVATELTADTCCALGVHSKWCGCGL